MKPLIVFVSAPYGKSRGIPQPELEANVARAVRVGAIIAKLGHTPIVPHLYHYLSLLPEASSVTEEQWLAKSMELLAHCDVLVRLPGESEGADRECQAAISRGIRIIQLGEMESVWESDLANLFQVIFRRHESKFNWWKEGPKHFWGED